ncbi:SubName: Full=Uncharacterized protein {ECO:0000313/EMBL:CCA78095.1} [Serendipita indica DSM 11827]|uniref:Uncharacterized protein n=1 Tax=Serendipita indica (strain DSM 11827) TaxID=1109443 RepID=G4U3B6_SERID|nr:SubName: Full=Uncharacterized protein {ECO:0000313/EMBL:CCA78095.1} [Serendipita indica DSM 11827]CCA78095.1 hypothetical protein PIIN_01768 [Serendipita indica DSM 11827]
MVAKLVFGVLAAVASSVVAATNSSHYPSLDMNVTTPRALGDALQIAFRVEANRFALVRLLAIPPNKTVTLAQSIGNVNATESSITLGQNGYTLNRNTTKDAEPGRSCTTAHDTGLSGILTFVPDQVGTWQWATVVDYFYGDKGYEQQGNQTCISPPFTKETLHIQPISITFTGEVTIVPAQNQVYSIDAQTISVPTTLSRNLITTATLGPQVTGTAYGKPNNSAALLHSKPSKIPLSLLVGLALYLSLFAH